MSDRPLVIVGISGFGRETADVVDASGRSILGFLDDHPSQTNLDLIAARGCAFLGGVRDWLIHADRPHDYLIGIGSGATRQRIAAAMDRAGHHAAIVIHPSATTGFGVSIGEGSIICAGTRLSNHVSLGRHVHLNPNTIVGHDSVLSDFVSLNPTSNVSGTTMIGARTLVGAGATLLQNLTIGPDVLIGACALVTKNVPPGKVVKGIPGRW